MELVKVTKENLHLGVSSRRGFTGVAGIASRWRGGR